MIDPQLKQNHHHGNLRAALIDAGIALLVEGGREALTLRKCAARAGVSHAAPAHHFAGIDGLRYAIAGEAFERFRKRMVDFADAEDQSPKGRLKGIAKGYLAFAREQPALYDLIFSFRSDPVSGAKIAPDTHPSYQLLRDTCAPFVPQGTDPREIETQVWSLVHGFAMLTLAGQLEPGTPSEDAVLQLLDRFQVQENGASPA